MDLADDNQPLCDDEAGVCCFDRQRLEGSGDRDGVGDGDPGSATDAELTAESDVHMRVVDTSGGVGVGDVAARVGAARRSGRAKSRAVTEDIGVAVQGGPDLDLLAEHGESVCLAGLESGLGPGHSEVRRQSDQGDVAFGLDVHRWLGPRGVVECGQDLTQTKHRLARDKVDQAGGSDDLPTSGRHAVGAELSAVQPDQRAQPLRWGVASAGRNRARAKIVCATECVVGAGVSTRVLVGTRVGRPSLEVQAVPCTAELHAIETRIDSATVQGAL